MYIERNITNKLKELIEYFPAVAIIGPRQVGKTTLIKKFLENDQNNVIFLDLESLSDLDKLNEPELFLKKYEFIMKTVSWEEQRITSFR